MTPITLGLLFAAGLWAGTQNALAGGGSFITIPALMLAGLDARSANITSSVALYPGQVVTGLAGRRLIEDAPTLSFKMMCVLGASGGLIGALALLWTPSNTFKSMLPWLILFATGLFAWSAFGRGPATKKRQPISTATAVVLQSAISIYGGYFGGGIGFMTVASLGLMGLSARPASATKNALAAVINTTSLLVFVFSPSLVWIPALLLGAGAIVGGLAGAWLVQRVPEKMLRILIVIIGIALTVALFVTR
jgi:uncharacterized membrane protein YfcA